MDNANVVPASREEMRRLGLIRYQLTLALRQAEQPHPLNGFSLLGFQDSIESFLHLAAGHIGADIKSKDFDKLVDGVSNKLPDSQPLGYRMQLMDLNHARVNLKHHGNLPDQGTIERHQATTIGFLDEATRRLFGIAFDAISLAHLIPDAQTRQHVERAEQAWQAGDVRQAMLELRRGFNLLFKNDPRRSARPAFGLPSILNSRDNRKLGLEGIVKWLERVDKDLTSVDHRLTLLSRGIDVRRYEYFMANTPVIHGTPGREVEIYFNEQLTIDQAVFDSCRQFVIDAALQLSEG